MATDQAYVFTPTYAYPPGDTLVELLDSRQMTQAELAERTGLTPKTVNEIAKGKAPVTPETALHLERVLGLPASFWNNLQKRFDEWQARQAEDDRLKRWVTWARKFPLREMARWGWVDPPKDQVGRVRCLLNFFGTATPDAWQANWRSVQVAFRTATRYKIDHHALASWLRQGEIEGSAIETKAYDQARFLEALTAARVFSRLEGVEFVDRLTTECALAGVAVVLIPELPRIRTYGATRWLSPNKALVQLSLRQKTDDQLWFSFFHEAAHILLHPKRKVFLEQDGRTDEFEREADNFASEHLIAADAYDALIARGQFDAATITAFAADLEVSPGIVVGRLQHDKHVPYKSWLNQLKRWYHFTPS